MYKFLNFKVQLYFNSFFAKSQITQYRIDKIVKTIFSYNLHQKSISILVKDIIYLKYYIIYK